MNGIRAISVAMVFFAHAGLGHLIPGGLGVTIFFVLSGYLITTLMRTEFAKDGTLDFRAFYQRRLLRLTPPLLAATLLSLLLAFGDSLGSPFGLTGLLSVLFYSSNYFSIAHDGLGQPPGLGITWSLAVEEHYYFIYPPLALLLMRLDRKSLSAVILTSLCLTILGWRCWLLLHGASENRIYMGTDTRIDAILCGAILALTCNPWLDPPSRRRAVRDRLLPLMWFGMLAGTLLLRDEFFRNTLRYTLQSLSIAGVLYFAVARADMAAFRWLNNPLLVHLGKLSYSIYLVHFMILMWVEKHLASWGALGICAATALITLITAEIMWRLIDEPLAALRRRLHQAHKPAAQQNSPTAVSISRNAV